MRLIGLPNRFSNLLIKDIYKQNEEKEGFNTVKYNIILNNIYNNFTTNDLVKRSKITVKC